MAMNCENCGAEVFDGQRFCRSCGRPVSQYLEENVPTQMMQPGTQGQRSQADTAPPSNPYTSPVYTPPGYYQPIVPPVPMNQPYTPPRSRSGWVWIVALVGVVVFGFVVMGVFFLSRANRRPRGIPPPLPQ